MLSNEYNNQENKIILESVLHKLISQRQTFLMAINTDNLKPRLLTSTDDKCYLVFFSSLEQVHLEKSSISFLAQPSEQIFKLAANSKLDGAIINPWGKRITIPIVFLRHIYYSYQLIKYIEGAWWNSPSHTDDFEALMWNNDEPYDEIWLEELIERQNQKTVNVAWWAKEQPRLYKKPPLFMQIWLAFYGLYWLQTIFTAGLNTLYYKEIDEANIYLGIILSLGIFLIFKYLHKFNNWWYKREEIRQQQAEQLAWEAGKEERAQRKALEADIQKKAEELLRQQKQRELSAIQALEQECVQ